MHLMSHEHYYLVQTWFHTTRVWQGTQHCRRKKGPWTEWQLHSTNHGDLVFKGMDHPWEYPIPTPLQVEINGIILIVFINASRLCHMAKSHTNERGTHLTQPLLSQRSGSGCGAGSCHRGHPPHPPASFQILLDQTTAIRNNTLAEKPCPRPPRDTLKEPSRLLCREAGMDAGPALLGNSTWGKADSLARLCQLVDPVHETIFVSPAAAWSCLLLSTTHLCQH